MRQKSVGCAAEMDGPLRVGNPDFLLLEARENPVPELLLHGIPVHKFPDPANEGNFQGGFRKGKLTRGVKKGQNG